MFRDGNAQVFSKDYVVKREWGDGDAPRSGPLMPPDHRPAVTRRSQPRMSALMSVLKPKGWTVAVAAALAVLAAAGPARASILPDEPQVTDAGQGRFIWSYAAGLSAGSQIETGDSFTITDFAGFIAGGVTMPSGWSVAFERTTDLPSGLTLEFADDPNVENLRFVYTGPTTIVSNGPNGLALGIFSAMSIVGPSQVHYSSTVYINHPAGNIDGPATSGQGVVRTPTGVTLAPVPEPSSYALMGLGAALLAARARRRRRDG